MASSRLPDLVRDSRLETEFRGSLTIHSHRPSESLRRGKKERTYWENVKEIGRGGFGIVHLETRRGPLSGIQPELRAVKRIRHATHRQLLHELEAIAKFSNEKYESCFVKSFGWYETKDCLYIAMEYLPSGDLHRCLSDKPALSEQETQDITFQILEGTCWMHDNDFAHRDIKPQNILVKRSPPDPWWVKIGDFGISKRIEDNTGSASTVKGTLQYMAPELFISKRNGKSGSLDMFATDIWAVGCMTFRMLTGSTPFSDVGQLVFYARNQDELPVSLLQEHQVSTMAQNFIGSLLARSPEQRPTAEDALSHEWIAHLSVEADGGSLIGEDLEHAIQAQNQPEHQTTTILTENMQSWTTKPAEELFPEDKNAPFLAEEMQPWTTRPAEEQFPRDLSVTVRRAPEKFLALAPRHEKPRNEVFDDPVKISQPQEQLTVGATLSGIPTERRQEAPQFPQFPAETPPFEPDMRPKASEWHPNMLYLPMRLYRLNDPPLARRRRSS